MNKGIIIYRSKYGATRKYADWLAEETGFDLVETKKAVWSEVQQYETIVLCGGIYASGISGLSTLKKNIHTLKGKKTALFGVGASPYEENAFREIKERNLKGGLENIPLFYGRGIWDEERMNFKDKALCSLLQKAVAKKDSDTCEPWMKALMCAAGQKCDWTDKKYLKPLLDYLEKP